MARKYRDRPLLDSPLSDLGLISSLLPTPSQAKKLAASDDEELDSETEEILRDATLLLIRLFYTQTRLHLDSMKQELELLVNAPPLPPHDRPHEPGHTRTKDSDSDMWKIEPRASVGSGGPLLDASGKV